MYYNCGCLEPDDPMGRGKVSEGREYLTEDDLNRMAVKWKTSLKRYKKEYHETSSKNP